MLAVCFGLLKQTLRNAERKVPFVPPGEWRRLCLGQPDVRALGPRGDQGLDAVLCRSLNNYLYYLGSSVL